MTFTITLPYPGPVLSPNARAHWRKVSAARVVQKREAFVVTYDAVGSTSSRPVFTSARLTLTFHPRTAHRFDLDNALASMKGAIDGISAALNIDDSKFAIELRRGEKRKGGAVVVTVEAK